jgi:hypothetical protein
LNDELARLSEGSRHSGGITALEQSLSSWYTNASGQISIIDIFAFGQSSKHRLTKLRDQTALLPSVIATLPRKDVARTGKGRGIRPQTVFNVSDTVGVWSAYELPEEV